MTTPSPLPRSEAADLGYVPSPQNKSLELAGPTVPLISVEQESTNKTFPVLPGEATLDPDSVVITAPVSATPELVPPTPAVEQSVVASVQARPAEAPPQTLEIELIPAATLELLLYGGER